MQLVGVWPGDVTGAEWIRGAPAHIFEGGSDIPLEMEKQIKFTQLVANAIMLSNVLDMSGAIRRLIATGYDVTTHAVAELSPYIRQQIARYGEWSVDITDAPPPLDEHDYANDLVAVLLPSDVA